MKARGDPDYDRLRELFEKKAGEAPPKNGNGHAGAHWRGLGQKSKGGLIPNLSNALLALRNDPEWVGKLRFDQMARRIIGPEGPLEDHHLLGILEWLQKNGMPRMGPEATRGAVEIVAHANSFHPLHNELRHTEWDGQPRLSSWLTHYLGTEDSHYSRTVGALFLIQMIARTFQPGCQADYMLVLWGEQGEFKSQACRVLGGTHFSSHLPNLDGDPVRLSMHLRGKWLIEVDELAAFSRSEINHLKSFITRPVEKFTGKYARNETEEPRQCCLIGTTNDPRPLRDETGNRRFWVVKCGEINLDFLRRDRDQLFAEALDCYDHGAQWWPDQKFEHEYIEPVQEEYRQIDAWADPLDAWLTRQNASEFSLAEIAQGALDLLPARLGMAEQRRLGALLREMGWELFRPKGKTRRWRRMTP